MTTHDRCCPLDDSDGIECAVCDAIVRARSEEIAVRESMWRLNLPSVARRNYVEGYRDAANGRPMRDSDRVHQTP